MSKNSPAPPPQTTPTPTPESLAVIVALEPSQLDALNDALRDARANAEVAIAENDRLHEQLDDANAEIARLREQHAQAMSLQTDTDRAYGELDVLHQRACEDRDSYRRVCDAHAEGRWCDFRSARALELSALCAAATLAHDDKIIAVVRRLSADVLDGVLRDQREREICEARAASEPGR